MSNCTLIVLNLLPEIKWIIPNIPNISLDETFPGRSPVFSEMRMITDKQIDYQTRLFIKFTCQLIAEMNKLAKKAKLIKVSYPLSLFTIESLGTIVYFSFVRLTY